MGLTWVAAVGRCLDARVCRVATEPNRLYLRNSTVQGSKCLSPKTFSIFFGHVVRHADGRSRRLAGYNKLWAHKDTMPAIGSLRFALDDGFDSGVALRLANPPEDAIGERYADSQLVASPDTPFVLCLFNGATGQMEAIRRGTELLQKALDLHSMLGRGNLLIKDRNDEQFAWWSCAGRRHLSFTSTSTFSARAGNATVVVRDAEGNIVEQAVVVPRHHVGFRFFRLAQVSDDLYDAFRSMYLAFESLLSSAHPKGKEQEIQWLDRALRAFQDELNLTSLCPTGTADCVSYILEKIYKNARLPLFHAKDGRTYFAPGGAEGDRATVQSGLKLLTEIVIRMAAAWHSTRRRGGWVNLRWLEEGFRQQAAGCQVVLSDQPTDINSLKDAEHISFSLANGVPSPGAINEIFDGTPRTSVTATFDVSALQGRTHLHAIYVAKDGEPLIGVTPDTVVDLDHFDQLDVRLFLRGRNANQPRSYFPR